MGLDLRRLLLLSALLPTLAFADSHARRPHVDVDLFTESTTVEPGGKIQAGILFRLEKGWHVYWHNAGDSGEPPKVAWDLPAGVTAGEIQWPMPERIEVGPLVNYGYQEQVLLPIPLSVSSSVKEDELHLQAHVRWLVCQESCIPGQAKLELPIDVRPGQPERGPQASFFDEVRVRLPSVLPHDWKVSVDVSRAQFELKLVGALPATVKSVQFFPGKSEVIDNPGRQTFSRTPDGLELRVSKSDQLAKDPTELGGLLVIDGKAYEFSAPVVSVAEPASGTQAQGGLLGAVFFALLGGLILNLMPCVFPVLSIKALSLVSMSGRSAREVRGEGVAYTLGILISFWVFAAAMLTLRSGGHSLGWGFQLQSPIFIGELALLLFLMSLNLLGVFEVSIGKAAGAGQKMASAPGYVGSFFTGALATLVATPCTAPFMGTALGFAMSQPLFGFVAVFTALGLGLALPYLALSLRPGLATYLPRPGRWMESFRQFLAFPLLATVVWLAWVYSLQTGSDGVAIFLSGLLISSLGAWTLGRWRTPVARAVFVGALILAAVAAAHGARESGAVRGASVQASGEAIDWQPFSRAKLDELKTAKKPVFIDFTAAWCVTCKVNEKLALTSTVAAAMRAAGVTALRGDWTNGDPEITRTLAEFGRNGVPLYLFYTGKAGEQPRILPQILTPGAVLQEIQTLHSGE